MLTIQLYGLAEHPKTQLLKVSLLDALVELPLAFSFVQISTLDAFLEKELPEVPCLMVNGGLLPQQAIQSPEALSEALRSLAIQQLENDATAIQPRADNGLLPPQPGTADPAPPKHEEIPPPTRPADTARSLTHDIDRRPSRPPHPSHPTSRYDQDHRSDQPRLAG